MNDVPSATRIHATLTECRRLVAEAVAREEQIQRDFVRRSGAVARSAEAALTQLESEAAERRQAQSDTHRQTLARVMQRYQARKDRIHKAQVECRKRANQHFDREDGREVFGFQKETLDLEKRRDADLAAAQDAFTTLSAEIARDNDLWQQKEAALRSSLGAFGLFRRWLSPKFPWPAPDPGPDEYESMKLVQAAFLELDTANRQARRSFLPILFRLLPLWLAVGILAAAYAAAVYGLPQIGRPAIDWKTAGAGVAGALALFWILKFAAQQGVRLLAERAARQLSNARHWLASATETSEARRRSETARIGAEYVATTQNVRELWSRHESIFSAARSDTIQAITRKSTSATARNDRLHAAALARVEQLHDADVLAAGEQLFREKERLTATSQAETAQVGRDHAGQWAALLADWQRDIGACAAFLANAASPGEDAAPDWNSDYWKQWEPPTEYAGPARIGTLSVEVRALAPAWPTDSRLAFPGPGRLTLPLWLAYPEQGSVVIETDRVGSEEAGAALNNIAYRLLCRMPPGRLTLTVLDPVGLGQTFASLMHLADYAEGQGGTGQRIWTEPAQIEERLAELTAHLEKVIQMYLRNDFANLAEYNAQAGSIAERHHLLVVTGFPVNFSDSAARRLLNLITNGGRCGIITLLHWDRRHPVPAGFIPDDLRKAGVHIVRTGSEFVTTPLLGPGVRLTLDAPPPELATELLHRIGRGSRDANKVMVPFAVIAPPVAEIWSESTIDEIRVPIGRTGASKLQYLSLGRGTRQHALISGKTGSGKSNLLHVIITNLALRCSPGEIEFYLIDFKKGVEFKSYATARLSHARVVAIESDREFGLSVLERLDGELRRRGELFRDLGVQDVPGYRNAGGGEPMPRCLLLVDEFQEYFVQEDRISQNAAVLLDRIVRQGRAFGIHVILASQTLGGTYALARATLGQMAVRIAFHCDEADAYLIMGDDNPAPRLLSRPGEGIYNDSAGALEANSPFQAVWLPDDIREQHLAEIHRRCEQSRWNHVAPVVFEGSAPANIEDNPELRQCLASPPGQAPATPTAWLGAPNSIKGPTAAVFSRSSGSNLLVVGQREESSLAIAVSALVSLAAQHPPQLARFVLVDTTPPGTARNDILGRLADALPHAVERVAPGQLPAALATLSAELDERIANGSQGRPVQFLVIVGLQNCKKLKPDDSYGFSADPADASANASAVFQNLFVEGPSNGIHTIALVDSYNNVNRFLGRKGLSEFEMRVLLQMSASDSSSLSDQPSASNLGLYGAIYYNDREGRTETFRPYSLPEVRWLEEMGNRLRRTARPDEALPKTT